MTQTKTAQTAFILNVAIVALEAVGFAITFARPDGADYLKYYTQESNLLLLAACFVAAMFQWPAFRHGRDIPAWVRLLKYVATCCIAVTLAVVIFVLSPSEVPARGCAGYFDTLWGGTNFYFHFVCPILGIVNFIFFEKNSDFRPTVALLALLPTVLYAAIAMGLNIARLTVGPYFFLHVYEQPIYMSLIWCVVVLGGAYALAYALYRANRMRQTRKN